MPQEVRPLLVGEASEEAVRDGWASRKETETRDKGRGDYLKLPLSPPAAAATGSPSSLHLPSPPHWDRIVSPWRGNQTCRQRQATKG